MGEELKDVNQKLYGKYSICIELVDGRVSPLPIKVYEDDPNTLEAALLQYNLIFCDKITCGFENASQFIAYINSKFKTPDNKPRYNIRRVYLGKKTKVVDDLGNEKYKYIESGDLVFNDKLLLDNAISYSNKKLAMRGQLNETATSKIMVDESNPLVQKVIREFINGGYREYMKDDYIVNAFKYREKTNLENLDRLIRANSSQFQPIAIEIKKMIIGNYPLFRYIYLAGLKRKMELEQQEIEEKLDEQTEYEIQKLAFEEAQKKRKYEREALEEAQKLMDKIKDDQEEYEEDEIRPGSIVAEVGTPLTPSQDEIERNASMISDEVAREAYLVSGDASYVRYVMRDDYENLSEIDRTVIEDNYNSRR